MISANGTVKLMDPSMATNSPFNVTPGYLYSPELLSHNLFSLECSSGAENIDFFSNDIFALGLLMLQLGIFNK